MAFLGIRSSADDDAAGMRKYAQAKGFSFPILDDPNNLLADYIGAVATPSFFVVDKKGILGYRGGYDEDIDERKATKTYLNDAVREVLDGKTVTLKSTKSIGCSLPRVQPTR